MKKENTWIFAACLAAAFWLPPVAGQAQFPDGDDLIDARLVADTDGVVPGRPFMVGLHLDMADGWHTYWENPGDSGLPVSVDWKLPDGFRVTDLQWPLPLRLEEPGEIEVYAYKDEVLLLARVFPPREIDQEQVTLNLDADWLVCERVCLPGSATVTLDLPVVADSDTANEELFTRFREKLPANYRAGNGAPFEMDWALENGNYLLTIHQTAGRHFDFFPLPEGNLAVGHAEPVSATDSEVVLRIPAQGNSQDLPERLDGVVVEVDDTEERKPVRGWRLGRAR